MTGETDGELDAARHDLGGSIDADSQDLDGDVDAATRDPDRTAAPTVGYGTPPAESGSLFPVRRVAALAEASEAPSQIAGAVIDPRRALSAAAVAAGLFAASTLLSVLRNAPFDPVAVPQSVPGLLTATTTLALAVASLWLAFVTDRASVRTGVAFAAVFGVLPSVGDPAAVPAAVALAAGGGLALLGPLGVPRSYLAVRRLAVAAGLAVGLGVSQLVAVGLLPTGLRSAGGILWVAALVGLGIYVEGDRVALLAGAAGFVLSVAAGVTSPYLVGGTLLVGFAVVGVPYLLVALAVGGLLAAGVAAIRRGRLDRAVGVALLAVAGVPVTPVAATAAVLGGTLAVAGLGAADEPGDDAPPAAAEPVVGGDPA